MTEPIRAEVVALLADLNPDPDTQIRLWTHRDGRNLTPHEAELVGSATRAELQAARDYWQHAADHNREQGDAHQRILDLTAPYFATMPERTTMGQIRDQLTPADRAEFDRLADQVAPDGTIVTPLDVTPLRPLADHVSHAFALAAPEYNLRGDHDEDPFAEGEFTPAVTTAELLTEYGRTLDRLDAIPDGTPVATPGVATLIDGDGRELFARLDTITTPDEQTTAVLTALAEAVALDRLAAAARTRAVALMVAFEDGETPR